jgi:outer membrane immunogenic protein
MVNEALPMLRLAVSASALALLAGVATAADLPPPMAPPPAPMLSPMPIAFNWSGFYIGGHGGWGFGSGVFDDGFQIGGQVGVNWQWNSFVLGAEGDGSFVDWGGADAVGTIRLRGGLTFDRFLVYATGGAAFQDFSDVGWVAGGGGEYALTDAISVGVEYLHYDFGGDDADVVRGRVNWRFNSLFGG